MTDDDLAAIEARLAAATPGPHRWVCVDTCSGMTAGDRFVCSACRLVAVVRAYSHPGNEPDCPRIDPDVARLVAEVRRLRAPRKITVTCPVCKAKSHATPAWADDLVAARERAEKAEAKAKENAFVAEKQMDRAEQAEAEVERLRADCTIFGCHVAARNQIREAREILGADELEALADAATRVVRERGEARLDLDRGYVGLIDHPKGYAQAITRATEFRARAERAVAEVRRLRAGAEAERDEALTGVPGSEAGAILIDAIGQQTPEGRTLVELAEAARDEVRRLRGKLNSPELYIFSKGTVLEAAHQRERWGTEHDAGKEPQDWFWLVGFLAGKALRAHIDGDADKARHHTISTAAVCANWHAAISGTDNSMRPGTEEADRDC